MVSEFLRDAQFTAGWFGLMAMVWFGWAQEAPPKAARGWLGAGSVLGVGLAVWFGIQVARNWNTPTALDGNYHWFGVLVGVEVIAAGVGCLLLAGRSRADWMAWWVGMVVALHFVPLAWLLRDWTMGVFGGLLTGILLALTPVLRRRSGPTSTLVGPVMGSGLLFYGLITALVVLIRW